MATTRAEVDALAATAETCGLEVARKAIAQLDFEQAARVVFARAKRALSVPIELVNEIVPRMPFPPHAIFLLGLAEGNRSLSLVELLEHDGFPDDDIGFMLRAISIYVAWKSRDGDELRSRIAKQSRLLVHDCHSERDRSAIQIVHSLADELGDEALLLMLPSESVTSEVGESLELITMRAMVMMPRERLRNISDTFDPDLPIARAVAAAVVDSSPRIGRNDPCPCGSGQKFKRCHGGAGPAPLRSQPSPHAGQSPAPRRESREGGRSLEDVQMAPLQELSSMRLRRLETLPLLGVMDRLLKYRIWNLAERVLDEVDQREELAQHVRDEFRIRFVMQAQECSRFDLVIKHLREVHSKKFSLIKPLISTAVAIAERSPDALDRLLVSIERAVRDESGVEAVNLAGVLGGDTPALTIMLIRATVRTDRAHDSERLLRISEEARVRLGLPAGDRATAIYEALKNADKVRLDDAERGRLAAAAKADGDALRAALSESNRLARELDRRVQDLQQQLHERASLVRVVEELPVEAAETRALRAKIDDLQSMIRERNEEISDLRRNVSNGAGPEALPTRTIDPADRDDDWEDEAARERRVVVPVWNEAATSAISSVPGHVAREALRTVAELGAGDSAAWRAVKHLKGIPLLMTRIGIHHRLLFRVGDDTIAVVDLVARQGLDLALKRH